MKLSIKQNLLLPVFAILLFSIIVISGCDPNGRGNNNNSSKEEEGVPKDVARLSIRNYRTADQENTYLSFVDVSRKEFDVLKKMFENPDNGRKFDRVRIYYGSETSDRDALPTKAIFTGFIGAKEIGIGTTKDSFIVAERSIDPNSPPCPKTCEFTKSIFY